MSKTKWKTIKKSVKTYPGKNRENWEEFREFPGKNIAISREFPGREIAAVNPTRSLIMPANSAIYTRKGASRQQPRCLNFTSICDQDKAPYIDLFEE